MKIFFIGDSFIEYFDWQSRFLDHRVFNFGVSGETVDELLIRIDEIIKRYPPPDLIFIMTGANNVFIEDLNFFNSYRNIIERLTSAYRKTRIFMNSLLPTILDREMNETIQRINLSLKKIAQEMNAEFLDIYRLFIDEKGKVEKNYFLPDEVHLSERGYAQWAKALEGIINSYP